MFFVGKIVMPALVMSLHKLMAGAECAPNRDKQAHVHFVTKNRVPTLGSRCR